jgi:hypothetical protein
MKGFITGGCYEEYKSCKLGNSGARINKQKTKLR